jgi:hypothetical protein
MVVTRRAVHLERGALTTHVKNDLQSFPMAEVEPEDSSRARANSVARRPPRGNPVVELLVRRCSGPR